MKLTNDTIIKSTSYDQNEIMENIINLYIPKGHFDYDPTYSKGNFYKKTVQKPKFKSDLINGEDFIADANNLPIKDNVFDSICFDPPFVMGSGPSVENPKDGSNIINRRFGIFKNERDLWGFYKNSLKELYRILKHKGVLVFKCQDCIVSSRQCLSHVTVINYAYNIGFYPQDIFILLAKNRVLSGKVKNQIHARKYHSYFVVLKKIPPKVAY